MGSDLESINLFCLPFAGGSANVFKKYQAHFHDRISIIPVDLPGHGVFFNKPLLYDLKEMVDWIYNRIEGQLSEPFAIFGHSMGGHLGHGLIHRLIEEKKPTPLHFFISGNGSPSIPVKQVNYHLLTDNELIEKLKNMGGIPEPVLQERELLEIFLPIFKADFQTLSDYCYKKREPFATPITVFYSEDDSYSFDEISNWKQETSSDIRFLKYSGNHFFIFDHFDEIGKIISDCFFA